MLDILNWFVEFFKNIFSAIVSTFELLNELFQTVTNAILAFFEFTGLGILPSWMIALSVLILTVAVIKLILGRQHE